MSYCYKCGAQNESEATSCVQCGSNLDYAGSNVFKEDGVPYSYIPHVVEEPCRQMPYWIRKVDAGYDRPWTPSRALTCVLIACIWLACMGAAVGAIWGAALNKGVGSGALWGCVGSVIFTIVMSPGYIRSYASFSGFGMMMPGLYTVIGIIGLIVWAVT
jgi:hypothetical protein